MNATMQTTKVRYIPPTKKIHVDLTSTAKKRVAAYARVSTDSDEQFTSYEAQVDYYTNYIRSNAAWEFAGIYTDEGISATSTTKRDGFKQMLHDALDGKIDLIITKSVSRFARNTVDALTAIRMLREKGIEVYFEKENIYTLDSKVELLITIMSSLAQEESRSISENVAWGIHKRFSDGKVMIPYASFLGYRQGADGLPEIDEQEAQIVRLIYRLFLYGKSPSVIAKRLTDQAIPTPRGNAVWRPQTVESILTNEKYKGAALLQKKFTVDFLTKKKKKNEGELPQYYIEHSHPAIIEPDVFALTQCEMKRRKKTGKWVGADHLLSDKIYCGGCGCVYRLRVWHSNDQYRQEVWQCKSKYENKEQLHAPHVTEQAIKTAFVKVANKILHDKAVEVKTCQAIISTMADDPNLMEQRNRKLLEIEDLQAAQERLIEKNSKVAMEQKLYAQQFYEYSERIKEALARLDDCESKILERTAKRVAVQQYMKALEKKDKILTEFDEDLWFVLVEKVIIYFHNEAEFIMKDNSHFRISI